MQGHFGSIQNGLFSSMGSEFGAPQKASNQQNIPLQSNYYDFKK
jgi:hypothetical protein